MLADIKGTGVALVTPFNGDGSVDYQALNNLIKHVSNNGCEYLVVLGTTGETATLSKKEKKEILAFVQENNPKGLPIVLGIGGNNTHEVIDDLQNTDFTGVKAVLSVSPYYNKPSQEGLYRHFSAIAEASKLPIILYNVPSRTGMNMQANTVIRLAGHSNIIGIKEASGDLIQCMEIKAGTAQGFMLIAGDDLLAVPIISIGGVGSIAVLANIYPQKFSDMIRYALKGDFKASTELLLKFTGLNPLLYTEGNPVGAKAALEIMGLTKNNVRLPLAPSSETLYQAIKKEISKLS